MPYVTNKGVRVHYEVEGKGSPLVLVHGQCANLRVWYDYGYVEPLMKKSRLVLVDVRGHGLSDKPHDSKDYTMKLIVSDIVAVLDDLRIRKAHFLGYSLGGWIVFGIAKYAPERIHSLIIGSAHPYEPSARELAEYDSEIRLWKKGTEAVIAAIEKRKGSKLTPKMKAMLMSNDPKAIAALMSGGDYTLNLEDVLPAMKMPCLVYCGEGDGNYSGAKECVNSIPNATFVSLPGLSHLETFFQADVVLPHVTKFLEKIGNHRIRLSRQFYKARATAGKPMSNREHKMKENVAGLFDRVASSYDRIGPRFFSHFGHRLVALAQIHSGADVLDVAAGRGAVLFPTAERVGSHGHVVGVDLSAEMVRETTAEIEISGLKNATMQQMDAEQLAFPDASFDFVLCGLSIFFFPHADRALAEFRRVLKSGGRVGITTFSKDTEAFDWYYEILRSYSSADSQTDKGQKTASPAFDTPAELEASLSNAGFEGINVVEEGLDLVYGNEEELWSWLWSVTARLRLEQMDPSTLEKLKADVFRRVQVFKRSNGIHLRQWRVLFAFGTKSSTR